VDPRKSRETQAEFSLSESYGSKIVSCVCVKKEFTTTNSPYSDSHCIQMKLHVPAEPTLENTKPAGELYEVFFSSGVVSPFTACLSPSTLLTLSPSRHGHASHSLLPGTYSRKVTKAHNLHSVGLRDPDHTIPNKPSIRSTSLVSNASDPVTFRSSNSIAFTV
jgi:hypothetical protein